MLATAAADGSVSAVAEVRALPPPARPSPSLSCHYLCLKCLPNGAGASHAPFAFGFCQLHDQDDSEYRRVNPYRA